MNLNAPSGVNIEEGFADLPATTNRGPLRLEYRWIDRDLEHAPIALFLHEGLGSVALWKDWPLELCQTLGMRGLVYSRPGYGQSTPRPHAEKWPVDFMTVQARDVLPAFLDAVGVSDTERARMWFIGHSDGASIALLYASAFPHALAGAIAIAPHVFVEDISIASIEDARQLYKTTDLRRKLSRYHQDVDSAFYGWNNIWLAPEFRSWDIIGDLARINRPLLAIQAQDDQYGTMSQMDTIARHVRDSTIARLEQGGHSPHQTVPDTVNELIASYTVAHAT